MKNTSIAKKTFLAWAPFAVGITLLCALVYGTVQQNYREGLNDPQIQMAQDAATAIESGAPVSSVVPQTQIDIARSLSPWIAVYDASDTPIVSDALLDGAAPRLPRGEFDSARAQGNNLPHNTWQPETGVRQAVVVVPLTNGGFVAVGRNMKEVESREASLEEIVALGWLVTLAVTFAVQAFFMYLGA